MQAHFKVAFRTSNKIQAHVKIAEGNLQMVLLMQAHFKVAVKDIHMFFYNVNRWLLSAGSQL